MKIYYVLFLIDIGRENLLIQFKKLIKIRKLQEHWNKEQEALRQLKEIIKLIIFKILTLLFLGPAFWGLNIGLLYWPPVWKGFDLGSSVLFAWKCKNWLFFSLNTHIGNPITWTVIFLFRANFSYRVAKQKYLTRYWFEG